MYDRLDDLGFLGCDSDKAVRRKRAIENHRRAAVAPGGPRNLGVSELRVCQSTVFDRFPLIGG